MTPNQLFVTAPEYLVKSYQQNTACGSLCWGRVPLKIIKICTKVFFPSPSPRRWSGKDSNPPDICHCMQFDSYSVLICFRLLTTLWGKRFSNRVCTSPPPLPPEAKDAQMVKVYQRKMSSSEWGNDSALEIRLAAFLALTQEPPNLDSAHTAVVYSAILCQSPSWMAAPKILCVGFLKGCLPF